MDCMWLRTLRVGPWGAAGPAAGVQVEALTANYRCEQQQCHLELAGSLPQREGWAGDSEDFAWEAPAWLCCVNVDVSVRTRMHARQGDFRSQTTFQQTSYTAQGIVSSHDRNRVHSATDSSKLTEDRARMWSFPLPASQLLGPY